MIMISYTKYFAMRNNFMCKLIIFIMEMCDYLVENILLELLD